MNSRADALIGLLDSQLQLVGNVEPCTVEWATGNGSWAIQFVTNHRLSTEGKDVQFVGMMHTAQEIAKAWYVLPLAMLGSEMEVFIGPDF